jgi:large repetitive protein
MKILGRASLALSVAAIAVSVGGIGLSSASADVATQTITFTSTAPTAATFGSSYTVAATASSGLPVTFTVDAASTSVCTIAGAKVSFTGTGTCTIDANQAGNASYSAAPQVQQSSTVGPASQVITFTSTAPVGQVAGGPSYLVAASAPSGLPVTFTVAAASSSVCAVTPPTPGGVAGSTGAVSGATVNFIEAGTCTLLADQPGNANYRAATQARQSITVTAGLQTILFGFNVPAKPSVGQSYALRASTASGLAPALTVVAGSGSVCSLSGVGTSGGLIVGTVKFTGVGTCSITASQSGNSEYAAAPPVTQTYSVVAKAKAFPKPKPAGLTATTKRHKTKLAVSGKLTAPSWIVANKLYSGTVKVTVMKGKKTLATATGKLSAKNGSYSVTLAHATGATSVTVKFSGNAALTALSTKKTLG